ncbi:translocation/assembly module TamB domain-containing protein [Parabacteroides sp. PF5-9]|uniref:translocation/assembly module TamB domain-containing protein n=1 Tax=Parabacteroides sp. PF5-9 TaxID=1742404 RepID=UPI0024772533|nr:translocation/assembly module TamB domain-containing protein [Parabacteroides sp. PF5-9]
MPIILVNIPYIQRQITAIATKELSEHLGVPVQIGKVGISWFNRLTLDDVYLEDESGQPLLEANHLAAGFEMIPFMQGRFVFTTIRLFGFNIHLSKKSQEEPLNLQFIIDAFSSKDSPNRNPDIDLQFNSILIRRGNFTYHVANESKKDDRFDPNHIDIQNLNANITLKAFNKDSINANIKRLSFKESSGFTMEKLSMNLVSNPDSTFIDNFRIKLPRTDLRIDKATISHNKIETLSHLLNDAPINLRITPSMICLQDLSPFMPVFINFADDIELSAEATGYLNNINLQDLTLKYSDKMLFTGKMELRGISNPEEAYLLGRVNRMYITTEGLEGIVNNFSERPITLPQPVKQLGTIHFNGEISGFFDNLVAFGEISSAIGSIKTDILFGSNPKEGIATYVRGHMETDGLLIENLFEENNPYGNIQFTIDLDTHRPPNGQFSGNIRGDIEEVDFRDYKYKNILLSGNFKHNGFDGFIHINDPNGELSAEGMFQHQGQHSVFNFTANAQNIRLDSLNLSSQYENPLLSFSINADFTGNNIDNIAGSLQVDSFSFKTTPHDFFLKKLEIAAKGHLEDRQLTIKSDLFNGEVTGTYSFTTIIPSLMNTFREYVPAVINTSYQEQAAKENNFSLLLTFENTENLSNTFKLPFSIINQGRITGHYNNRYNKFRLEAWFPKFNIGNAMFESGHLVSDNPNEEVALQLNATNYNPKGLRNYLKLKFDAKNNRMNSRIEWANNKEQLFKADLITSTYFAEEKDEKGNSFLRTEISIDQSPLIIKDSLWNMGPAAITVQNNRIDIDNFTIGNERQYAHFDGVISKNPLDTLQLDLNKIELSYIFETLNIPVLQFGGEATGTFYINDLYSSRMLNTDLEVQNFSFNQVHLGRLNLFSEWDDAQRGILMLGSIYKNDSTWTDVSGYIFPVKPNEGLSLHFDANDVDIAFLHPFLEKVATNIQGHGFGQVHLYGPFKELTVEGNAYVKEGGLGIDFLNTYYTFSDSVFMDSKAIHVQNATVYDKFNNSAKVNLTFNHQYFKDYNFTANVQANNFLVYDKAEKDNPMIYGTVFGSGAVDINGNKDLVNFDINMQSAPRTSVNFNFMTNSASDEYNFITFIDKKTIPNLHTIDTDSIPISTITPEEGTEMRMNFLLDITPEANVELIMDPTAGDRIKGNGSGSVQVQYGTKSDLRIFGGVQIVDGNYNFSLQQLIHKNFKIREGSTIDFQGDPYNANMNINATYNLTANLGDLDEALLLETARASVPVNCVLMLDGRLRSPDISFDIEFPGSTDELQRQVRSLIDTDEMMMRQIVYLLVLNKFYTPDYTKGYGSNEFNAVASSAISSQLSSILNSFTDKVQIGTNIRAGQEGFNENTEVEMLLSSQLLDNRLIINGNLGYKNSTIENNNVFIGEFDLEYKLTPSGEIRLKAYNHANDMNRYLKQSLTTQGVGIMFKKEFTHPSELFRRKKRNFSPILEQPTLIMPTDSTTSTGITKEL